MKKIIASALGLALVLSVSVAFAQTTTTTTTTTSATFARNLTVGSSGADVIALQTILEAQGHLVMPAGVAKGYFGALTKTAVAKWQAAVGITPAAGFFGPISRAKIGTVVVGSGTLPAGCTSTAGYSSTTGVKCSTGAVTGPASGQEGQLTNIDNTSSDVESDLEESEKNVKVFGVEADAEDSEMNIERVDVDFTLTDAANGSDNIDDYITDVSIYSGDKKIATLDVDEASIDDGSASDDLSDDDNDVYSFRFTGLNIMVAEDATAEIYVAVTAVNNVDTGDANDEWAVIIPDDGIRAIDGAGISDTYVSGSELTEENFSISEPDAGDLDLSVTASDNKDRTIVLDADNVTDDVTVLTFTLESDSSDNKVDEIEIDLATTSATSTLFSSVINRLELFADGKSVGEESLTINASDPSATVVFDNLKLDIEDGEEVEFVVKANFKADADQREGFSFEASVDESGIEAEDSEGDDVTVTSGTYTGGDLELRTNGIEVELSGTPTITRSNATLAGQADEVSAEIKFTVTNNGDEDIYIDGDVVQGPVTPTTSTNGLSWATTSVSNTGTSTYTGILTASGDDSDDDTVSPLSYFVEAGESRTFTFTVTLPTGTDNGALGVRITGIKWDTDLGDAHANLYDADLGDLKTSTITGLMVR